MVPEYYTIMRMVDPNEWGILDGEGRMIYQCTAYNAEFAHDLVYALNTARLERLSDGK